MCASVCKYFFLFLFLFSFSWIRFLDGGLLMGCGVIFLCIGVIPLFSFLRLLVSFYLRGKTTLMLAISKSFIMGFEPWFDSMWATLSFSPRSNRTTSLSNSCVCDERSERKVDVRAQMYTLLTCFIADSFFVSHGSTIRWQKNWGWNGNN